MHRVIIVTGVAGSGKTTVGRAAAARLGWPFVDADDLHSAAAVDRIRQGIPLDDEIRQPWLLRVRTVIEQLLEAQGGVVACSALKARYRVTLAEGLDGVRFVFLAADAELLRERLTSRPNHFAGPQLLASQLEALEPPTDALWLDASRDVDALVEEIYADVRSS